MPLPGRVDRGDGPMRCWYLLRRLVELHLEGNPSYCKLVLVLWLEASQMERGTGRYGTNTVAG